jgi:SAM-dependent methyltransferase
LQTDISQLAGMLCGGCEGTAKTCGRGSLENKNGGELLMKETAGGVLPDGLVTLQQYEELIASDYFKAIEEFSNDFVRRVGAIIQKYNFRWVSDPLHQWSRQWEYPYIVSHAHHLNTHSAVVDLGAGISFLPYYLKRIVGLSDVLAVDYDTELTGLYKKVNNVLHECVSFQRGDIRQLNGIADRSVDFVYSVSVLEHTDGYPAILNEIHRILKPGGKLSCTFDISLNGLDDIPLEKAHELLACLEETFSVNISFDLVRDIRAEGLVTSQVMAQKDRKLMPWRFPLINVVKPMLKHGRPGRCFKELTFCCVTVHKGA